MDVRDVGLEVQKRRPVDDVDILNMKRGRVDSHQPHHRQPNGIRSARGARGEDSPELVIEKGSDEKRESTRQVEVIDEDEVGEPFEILQAFSELRQELNPALDPFGCHRLDRHVLRHLERAADDADRLVDDALHAF